MEKIKNFLNENIVPWADKFTSNRYVKIMMNGFMAMTAFTIGASFFTLIRSLPLGDWYTSFLQTSGLYDILNFPILITSELSSLYLLVALGYLTAKSFNKNGLNGSLVALGSFLMLIPQEASVSLTSQAGETVTGMITKVLPISSFGPANTTLAMIVGILAARIFVYFDSKNLRIKVPNSVPENIGNMFGTIIPATLVIVIFMAIRLGCSYTSFGSAQDLIAGIIQAPLTNIAGGAFGAFLYLFLRLIGWVFGIHSQVIAAAFAPVLYPIYTAADLAFANGEMVQNLEWISSGAFAQIGGNGSTLALAILLVMFAKSQHLKTLGKLAIIPSVFNINEPLVFGIPIVLNPFLAVPYVIAPCVNFFLTNLVNSFGFAVCTGANVDMFMPAGIRQAFLTGSIQGFIWAVVLILIDCVIYYPFFKANDKKKVKEEENSESLQLEDELI